MKKNQFEPYSNYLATMKKAGYVPRKEASQKDYDRIGFMSGLEVHQQLLTDKNCFVIARQGFFIKMTNMMQR